MREKYRAAGSALSLLALLAFGPAVHADGVSGLYLGGSVGVAKIATDNTAFQTQLQAESLGFGALNFTSASLHDRKTAWWANVGYMAWPYVGIDASYLHLGEMYNQVLGNFTPDGGTSTAVGAATRLRSEGPALGLLFKLPVVDNFDIDLRVADYYARSTSTTIFNSTNYVTTVETANRSSLLLGLGASYTFAGHWSTRLDYLRVQQAGDSASVGKYTAAMLSVGASYTF
jgi:opacity protein-like surface antigen